MMAVAVVVKDFASSHQFLLTTTVDTWVSSSLSLSLVSEFYCSAYVVFRE